MNIFKYFLIVSLLFISQAFALSGKVTAIQDGDTLTMTDSSNQAIRIRLMGMDTPELHYFEFSQGAVATKARDVLRTLLPRGSQVTIADDYQTDKHGRILGRVIRGDGMDVNKEMLRLGWGAMYFIYPFEKRNITNYSEAAKEAYEAQRGIFSSEWSGTQLPYIFRMEVRNLEGRNPVGDLETKRLYSNSDVNQVPVWKRVFFPSEKIANKAGYRF